MKVTFQTLHPESNSRLNASLCDIKMDFINHSMALMFDTSGYDADELLSTLERHYQKGVQNMLIDDHGTHYVMAVEPVRDINKNDTLTVVYTIIAHTASAKYDGEDKHE